MVFGTDLVLEFVCALQKCSIFLRQISLIHLSHLTAKMSEKCAEIWRKKLVEKNRGPASR